MSTLKNNLAIYLDKLAKIKEYFSTKRDLGNILDATKSKWYRENETTIVLKYNGCYKEICFCNTDILATAFYTVVITTDGSYILDNKLKTDKLTIFIEDGK